MSRNIRLIAGKYGKRVLDTPQTGKTHPMGERIRNALFNKIGNEIEGADVLDVFAGTGALGLEALSRGAASATFIEYDRAASKAIANNIATLHIPENEATLVSARIDSWLDANEEKRYDIIFVDPPYSEVEQHFSTINRILGLLKPSALMVLSKPDRCEEFVRQNGIVVVDNRSYSDAILTYYRREA